MGEKLPISELRLGDTVKLYDGAWCFGIVIECQGGKVQIFRPYGTCADFSYGGPGPEGCKVIPYTGFELCTFLSDSKSLFEVIERKKLK